jgi:hypothetical protein
MMMIKRILLSLVPLVLLTVACGTTPDGDNSNTDVNNSGDVTVRPNEGAVTAQRIKGQGCGICDAVLKDPPDWASICTLTKTECDEHGQLTCTYSCSAKRPSASSTSSSSSGVIQ